jgi:hypothetical protein
MLFAPSPTISGRAGPEKKAPDAGLKIIVSLE